MSSSFGVTLSCNGKTANLEVTTVTTGREIEDRARDAFSFADDVALKLLYKGKVLKEDQVVFASMPPKKSAKILVMASSRQSLDELNAKRSEPTIRGFDQEKAPQKAPKNAAWGTPQNKEYKFCRFQACTWQSFGHRATEAHTPHAFEAMQLLEKLATDPGVVAIMVERELVVGTLGEMDPIDDRLKQKKQQEGACLLGYNTNGGARIDIKLRPDSLKGFLPYPDLVSTLIHELSHNWVSDHNLVFWGNYAQMRVEYLHRHATMAAMGTLVGGKTTAELAGVPPMDMQSIASFVVKELQGEMVQHGLNPQLLAPAIMDRCRELTKQFQQSEQGQRVGGGGDSILGGGSARERALMAAERRANQQKQEKQDEEGNNKSP